MTLTMKYLEKKEEGRAEGRAEEHDKILENLTNNLLKRNPKLTLEEARKEAEDLIKVM